MNRNQEISGQNWKPLKDKQSRLEKTSLQSTVDINNAVENYVYYNDKGVGSVLDEVGSEFLNQYAARQFIFGTTTKNFIKVNKENHFYNPVATLGNHSKTERWRWIEVNNQVFESYINFLKTYNSKYLVQAERLGFCDG